MTLRKTIRSFLFGREAILLFSWICFPDRGRGYKHYIAYPPSAFRKVRGSKLLITAARCDNKLVGFLFRCINNPEATICLRAKAWIAYGNRQAPNNPTVDASDSIIIRESPRVA